MISPPLAQLCANKIKIRQVQRLYPELKVVNLGRYSGYMGDYGAKPFQGRYISSFGSYRGAYGRNYPQLARSSFKTRQRTPGFRSRSFTGAPYITGRTYRRRRAREKWKPWWPPYEISRQIACNYCRSPRRRRYYPRRYY